MQQGDRSVRRRVFRPTYGNPACPGSLKSHWRKEGMLTSRGQIRAIQRDSPGSSSGEAPSSLPSSQRPGGCHDASAMSG